MNEPCELPIHGSTETCKRFRRECDGQHAMPKKGATKGHMATPPLRASELLERLAASERREAALEKRVSALEALVARLSVVGTK